MLTFGESALFELPRPHAIIVCRTKAEIEAVREKKNSHDIRAQVVYIHGLLACTGMANDLSSRQSSPSAHLDWPDFEVRENDVRKPSIFPNREISVWSTGKWKTYFF